MTRHPVAGERAVAELEEALGPDVARVLARRFGGVRLYVPLHMGDDHPIRVALGREAADRIASWSGGCAIDIPKRAARRRRVIELREQGALTIAQIALDTDYSERHVYRLLSDRTDPRQVQLFDPD